MTALKGVLEMCCKCVLIAGERGGAHAGGVIQRGAAGYRKRKKYRLETRPGRLFIFFSGPANTLGNSEFMLNNGCGTEEISPRNFKLQILF